MSLTHYSPVLLFYTPWKHQKTFRFSDVFRGYKKVTLGCNGLIMKFLPDNNFISKSCNYHRVIDVKIWQFIFNINMCLKIRIMNSIEGRLKKSKTTCMSYLMEKRAKMQVHEEFSFVRRSVINKELDIVRKGKVCIY